MDSTKLKIPANRFILYSLTVVFIVASLVFQIDEPDNVIWTVVGVWLLNIIFATNKKKNRFTYLLFNITYFTFLLSRLVVLRIDGESLFSGYSDYTKTMVPIYLIVGLITITVGQLIYEKTHSVTPREIVLNSENEAEWERESGSLLFVTLALYYITYPLSFLDLLDKALFVGANSYSAYYLEYSSRLPYVLTKIGSLNRVAFVLLLCVEHRKRKLMFPCILYAITAVISLGMGQRNIFVLDVLMAVVLIKHANEESLRYSGERLYSRKIIAVIAVSIPVMIVFLGYWKYARAGQSFDSANIYKYFRDFFYSQGEQIGFFANTIEIKSQIWAQKVPYTFSAVYNYFRNLFGLIGYGIYTRENALYGNSLAATQFYITSPGSLVNGSGSGCCYLSELYFDFGAVGIIVGSLIIGYLLGKLELNRNRSCYLNAFVALMIRSIIYIPRASYLDWLATPFNIWNVAIVLCVMAAVNILNNRNRLQRKDLIVKEK